MRYFVILPDGQKFGPADLATLNQWITENRLGPQSMLAPEDGGPNIAASMVQGLVFPGSIPQPGPTQANPSAQPGQPMSAAPPGTGYTPPPSYGPGAPSRGVSAPTSGPGFSPYPRGQSFGPSEDVLKKFNWGAFFLTWIWGLNHKAYLTLISLAVGGISIPLNLALPGVGSVVAFGLGLGLQIWYGVKGNTWAWESGRFQSADEMEACQVIWAKWGVGILIAGCVCGVILGLTGAFSALMLARSGAGMQPPIINH